MLKISQKLEYAMRAMIELAVRRDSGELVPAREIAESQQVPLRFLEQQLGALHKAGLVQSFR
ncbi:MAG: Rrf2 family transcriptional regulator, partial [Candidatus Velamenicoccus archaeovorus]